MPSILLEHIASLPNLFMAWKKAKAYLRQYSWYFDPLEVELFEHNLEEHLRNIRNALLSDAYGPTPSLLVLAPKRIQEVVLPDDQTIPSSVLHLDRPLAHCALQDQLVWVAIMNQVADRFEDSFAHPDPDNVANTNYGNRLYRVMSNDGRLRFPAQNVAFGRQYYKDYSNFLRRSLEAAEQHRQNTTIELFELDVRKFYDSIQVEILLTRICSEISDEDVCTLLQRLLRDWSLLNEEGENIRIPGKGIPQGLIVSGILANMNRDLTTFDHLSEASIRDLHTYLVLANSGQFGGSQIIGPRYESHQRRLFRIEGQDLETVEVREINVEELREFQRNSSGRDGVFKSLPAGYQMSKWRK